MKIIKPEVIAEVPDGNRCVSWSPQESREGKDFKCTFFRDDSKTISAREAQQSGLGYSGGTISFFRCALFDVGLTQYEYGHGVCKAAQCLEAKRPK